MKIKLISALLCLSAVFLTGCATLDGPTDPSDPFESYNRSMDSFNNKLDRYVLKPVAIGYDTVTPSPVQKGVSNFFSNLDDVLVIFNDLFQFKFKQLASDTGRLVINSSLGIFGLIDWASDIGLNKHDEDFGQTLGYWGVSSGPYLILPLFGPSTIRDTGGLITDSSYLNPINNEVHEEWQYPARDTSTATSLSVVKAVDSRARLLKAEGILNEAALDRYIYIREAFLQQRLNLVHDGNPPKRKPAPGEEPFNVDDLFED
ncbi:MAG: phospholipid-binding lipoprotein MlaA [Gammaproteobacteria bacterium]|jgi:phospholipid-binding lipoprotein MlaA